MDGWNISGYFTCDKRAYATEDNWRKIFILDPYADRGEDFGNYHGLKLTDQVRKLMEWVLDFYIRKMINIDVKQFGFVPSWGTTDAIFIVH